MAPPEGLPHPGAALLREPLRAREAVERGYVVICPEYRGSTGYGEKHHNAIDYGGYEIDDVMSAVDYLKTLPHVDGHRSVLGDGRVEQALAGERGTTEVPLRQRRRRRHGFRRGGG